MEMVYLVSLLLVGLQLLCYSLYLHLVFFELQVLLNQFLTGHEKLIQICQIRISITKHFQESIGVFYNAKMVCYIHLHDSSVYCCGEKKEVIPGIYSNA